MFCPPSILCTQIAIMGSALKSLTDLRGTGTLSKAAIVLSRTKMHSATSSSDSVVSYLQRLTLSGSPLFASLASIERS